MILVVDIGNTTVSFGGVEIRDSNTYAVRFRTKLDTNCTWDAADYTVHLLKRLKSLGRELEDFSGVVISSVVPRVLEVIREAAYSIFGVEPLVITQESKLGIAVEVPEPEKVGRDRLVDCAWAAAHYELPLVTADLGTATTFNVIKEGGVFCGGVIAAGMETGLKALSRHTAQLPKLELAAPQRIVGQNTRSAMLSGAVYGTAAMLDGMVQRFCAKLNAPGAAVIATGTLPASIRSACTADIDYRATLVLDGLFTIWTKNTRR